jgi:hypothetical protein
MRTDCTHKQFEFEGFGKHKVIAAFDGGNITSDGGALLLRETDIALSMSEQVAACFTDGRDQNSVVHKIETLVAQRIHGMALGYEDLNDHDDLRHDMALGFLSDSTEPKRKNCAILAGKSTLNRLECSASSANLNSRYHKFSVDMEAMQKVFVSFFLRSRQQIPDKIILDLDCTDVPLHGDQEGKFFHGYYRCYCYMPLYIFCGRDLLAARLQPSNIDGAACAVEEIMRIVMQIREAWPDVEIELRADGGFCRDELKSWCELNGVGYVIGLPQNSRLRDRAAAAMSEARRRSQISGKAERVFTEFAYCTRDSWSCERRVIAKAEYLPGKDGEPGKTNYRFIVTSRKRIAFEAREIYEEVYCARGDMENRIKECQLDLFADRTSTATMAANQLRLWFSSLAYVLVNALRRIALKGTRLAKAMPGTIRLKLFKIGALVTKSVRRIKLAMASNCPGRELFKIAHERLRTMAA